MFSGEEMLFLGAGTVLITAILFTLVYNSLFPKQGLEVYSGADVKARDETLTQETSPLPQRKK